MHAHIGTAYCNATSLNAPTPIYELCAVVYPAECLDLLQVCRVAAKLSLSAYAAVVLIVVERYREFVVTGQ